MSKALLWQPLVIRNICLYEMWSSTHHSPLITPLCGILLLIILVQSPTVVMWRDVLVLTVGSVLGRTVPGPWLEGPDHGEVRGERWSVSLQKYSFQVHYYYHRHFLVPQPYWAPPLQGYSVKQGDHFSDKVSLRIPHLVLTPPPDPRCDSWSSS